MNGYYEQGDPLNADGITNGVNGLHVSSSDEESDDDALNVIIPIGLSRISPLAFFLTCIYMQVVSARASPSMVIASRSR